MIAIQPERARLRAGFQELEGEVTHEGLWLKSTVDEERFGIVARRLGRTEQTPKELPRIGQVSGDEEKLVFTRLGLIEEFRVSMDGVRQDFVVTERPEGAGQLQVMLDVSGATATAAGDVVKLRLARNGREIGYHRLRVTDAAGRELEARMAVNGLRSLSIEVEDAGAQYPVRIDPTYSDADWAGLNPLVPGVVGTINAMAADAAGNVYVGGNLKVAGGVVVNNVAKWDGNTWSNLGTGMNGTVHALAVMGTDLYAGGVFGTAGGVAVYRIAKWNGSVWSPLGTGMDDSVEVLAVSGNDLYAGGSFTMAGGIPALRVAKWNGSSWSALGSGISDTVYALAVHGAEVYAGGNFRFAGGLAANRVAKWDGTAWSALGSGMDARIETLAVSGTDLYAGGSFTMAGGVSASRIAKWNGSTWSPLGSGMNDQVIGLQVSGNEVYAAGWFVNAGGTTCRKIAKWNGTNWSAVGSGIDGSRSANAVLAIGTEIYAGGDFVSASGVKAGSVAKWTGTNWMGLGESGIVAPVGAMVVAGTDLFVAEYHTSTGSTTADRVSRWNGSEWSTIGQMNGDVEALAWDGTHLYAGGRFSNAGGVAASRIAKWDGSNWSPLGTGMGGGSLTVLALACDGSNLYAGGSFTTAGGVTVNRVAKWNGNAWSALGLGMEGDVRALKIAGTDVYAGGAFLTAGGVTVNRVAKWNGSAWSALGSGMDGNVLALTTTGNDLYAGGAFTAAGGIAANRVAKWDGSAWSALGSGTNGDVNALAVSGSDLFAGGLFSSAGGVSSSRIARWNGNVWSPLGAGVIGSLLSFDGSVDSMTGDGAGHLFVGGYFSMAGSTVTPYLAQLNVKLQPEIAVQDELGNVIEKGFSWAFGDVNVGTSVTQVFTVKNTGAGALNFTAPGPNFVTLTGASDYQVTTQPASSAAAFGSTTFAITFTPTGAGGKGGTVRIANDDDDENPFTFSLTGTATTPEIAVEQPEGTNILDGGSVNFGGVELGATASRTFTIKNLGTGFLTGLTITKSGGYSGYFTVTSSPASSIAPTGSTTFTVQFAPGARVPMSAVIRIANNDSDENPFDITLTGTGNAPEIEVSAISPSDYIFDGEGINSDSYGAYMDEVRLNFSVSRTFIIKNEGTSNLTGLSITKDGEHAEDFSLTTDHALQLAPGETTAFTLTLTPKAVGLHKVNLHIANNDSNENPFDFGVVGSAINPEIEVEDPSGIGLADGEGRDVGGVVVGTQKRLSFTMKNTGYGNLSGLSAKLEGDHASDFSVSLSPLPGGWLSSGNSAIFYVWFNPKDVGPRNAVLRLGSNDGDENPFDIVLTGLGEPPPIRFTASKYTTGHGAAAVEVRVVRTYYRDLAAAVTLKMDDGVASAVPPFGAAMAGIDYADVEGGIRVNFAKYEFEKTVLIPLIVKPHRAGSNRRFTVTLSDPDSNAAVGNPSTTIVEILATDVSKPTLTVSAPAGSNVGDLLPYVVTGTAGDIKGIDRVEVTLNGGAPMTAALGDTKTPTKMPFSLAVIPSPGPNTVVVTAYDLRGNSTTVTRNFGFTQRYQLTLNRNDVGLGTVALKATPANSATALNPAAAESNPQAAEVTPGTEIKLSAKAQRGFVFRQWSGLPEGGLALGDEATFVMPSADLAVTAEFVATPFGGLAGSFYGLIHASAPTVSGNATEGLLTGTLTATGGFTGKVYIDGVAQAVTGVFYGDGSAVITASGKKMSSLPFGGRTLTLGFDFGANAIAATVTKGGDVSEGVAARAIYSTANKTPAALLNSATKGAYTMSLGWVAPDGAAASTYPRGLGYATIGLTNVGVVSVAGVLADGSAITAGTALVSGDEGPMLVQLPTPGGTVAQKGASVSGTLAFDPGAGHADVRAPLRWFRPVALGTKVVPYRNGWPQGIDLDGLGELYDKNVKVQTALNLGPIDPDIGHTRLLFIDGKLSPEIEHRPNINGNAVGKVPVGNPAYLLTITPATGLFSGSFVPNWANPAAAKPGFKGVILQGDLKAGTGFFISNAKGDVAPESGSVTLFGK